MYRVQIRIGRNEYVSIPIALHYSSYHGSLLSSHSPARLVLLRGRPLNPPPIFPVQTIEDKIEWHLILTQAPHVDMEGKKVPGLPLVVEN